MELGFEQAMARLEEIAKILEKGDIPLEKSLEYFEEGTALVKHCRGLLEKAEQTVKLLVKGEDGELKLENFNAENNE
jgi:exodeoxyribonuclease VII small subunit